MHNCRRRGRGDVLAGLGAWNLDPVWKELPQIPSCTSQMHCASGPFDNHEADVGDPLLVFGFVTAQLLVTPHNHCSYHALLAITRAPGIIYLHV